jgi:hypothetical protein
LKILTDFLRILRKLSIFISASAWAATGDIIPEKSKGAVNIERRKTEKCDNFDNRITNPHPAEKVISLSKLTLVSVFHEYGSEPTNTVVKEAAERTRRTLGVRVKGK